LIRTGRQSQAINHGNFDDYPVARIPEAPYQTNVYIVESDAPAFGPISKVPVYQKRGEFSYANGVDFKGTNWLLQITSVL